MQRGTNYQRHDPLAGWVFREGSVRAQYSPAPRPSGPRAHRQCYKIAEATWGVTL